MFENKISKSEKKIKMQKYQNTRKWARGCETESGGCQKQEVARPSPATSSSSSVQQKFEKMRLLHRPVSPVFVIF